MRIAAGVLLIIASVLNIIPAFGYALGGAAGAAVGQAAAEQVQKDAAAAAASNPGVDVEALKKLQEDAQKAGAAATSGGGIIMFVGIFLLVLVGLQIAGGVVLFREKAAGFALIVGVLSLVGEGGSSYVKSMIGGSSFSFMQAVGILGGLLAIVASRSYANKNA